MKIPGVAKIREADIYTIENEYVASIDLMERAAKAVFLRMTAHISQSQKIWIFCGSGNNGGDGLALGRMLINIGFNVCIFTILPSNSTSADFNINLLRVKKIAENQIFELKTAADFPKIQKKDVVVDAIFGSGLNKRINGFVADVIDQINASEAVVISIDIPSGLFTDQPIDIQKDKCINADYTFTFEFPKLAFLFPEYEFIVGLWEVLPIGLHQGFLDSMYVKNYLLTGIDVNYFLKKRLKFSHKGTFGHALLIAGSQGKTGAAILAAKACLRSGVGLLHVHLPKDSAFQLISTLPEAMISADQNEICFSQLPDILNYTSAAVGPGIGKSEQTCKALKLLIQEAKFPVVFDADALNILSENKTWLSFLPAGSILTPHPKEFERLVGKWSNSFERLQLQRDFSVRHKLIIAVKGAHTCISDPNGNCWFNSTGNPGMATAGSGDVLTGIILGLLAQHYTPLEAAKLGVYLHGLAGDLAVEEMGMESLIASDIVQNISKAFKRLNES